jgi:AcrR family transcriptional regulator
METVELLWRHEHPLPRRTGRPPKISVDDVIAAGIAEADAGALSADGIGADLTLRAVAARLGVGVMTLYGHVENREQLLDLMEDQCLADELAGITPEAELTGDWRSMLEQVAEEYLDLLGRHPWLADRESERAILGPGTLGTYERRLRAVEPLPLRDAEKDQVLSLVLAFVRSAARSLRTADAERAREAPEQWWAREGEKLAQLDLAGRFPLADRIGSAAGEETGAAVSARHGFAFGLQVILDGVAGRAKATDSAWATQ